MTIGRIFILSVAVACVGLVVPAGAAADPVAAPRQWRTDAREVRHLPFKQHKDMLAEHIKEYGQNTAIDRWMERVTHGSGSLSPGVRTISAVRFTRRIVYGLILICPRAEQTKHYFIVPIQFDNSGREPDYADDNFMCGTHV
jgi:hypothetical protein